MHGRPEGDYAAKFTHSDLVTKNIMVDDDAHVVGIVDWEFSGWYPEYWEYTKAFFTEMRPQHNIFYRAFETQPGINKYPEELACEHTIWMRMGSPWCYCDPPWQPGDDDKPKDGQAGGRAKVARPAAAGAAADKVATEQAAAKETETTAAPRGRRSCSGDCAQGGRSQDLQKKIGLLCALWSLKTSPEDADPRDEVLTFDDPLSLL